MRREKRHQKGSSRSHVIQLALKLTPSSCQWRCRWVRYVAPVDSELPAASRNSNQPQPSARKSHLFQRHFLQLPVTFTPYVYQRGDAMGVR